MSSELSVIERKVKGGSYQFTPYKELLLSKGRSELPRVISVPTVRDQLVLGILKSIIDDSFSAMLNINLMKQMVANIDHLLRTEPSIDTYIKLDIKNFYGSINHNKLFRSLKTKIRKTEIIDLINKAIRNPTVPQYHSGTPPKKSDRGIPQGISIANVLASVYLATLDDHMNKKGDGFFFRYVDDILVLCHSSNKTRLNNHIKRHLRNKYTLKLNEDKSKKGLIKDDGFTYLGYLFKSEQLSVRNNSVRKLEDRLEKLFSDYKHGKLHECLFIWKLNQKITGCICQNRQYGWLFFFSQMTDLSLLYHLDWLIQHYFKRFDVPGNVKVKKFVKAYFEITKKLHSTKYIPNYDTYSPQDKREYLREICKINVCNLDDQEINIEFYRYIFRSIKELEKDIQRLS